jgi:hypothetical protein
MATVPVTVSPSRDHVKRRLAELTAESPQLAARLERLREFSRSVRTSQVFLTNACNIRCKGCWFFEHDLDKGIHEVRDIEQIRAFAQGLKEEGVSHVLLLGGEPTLVLDRVQAFMTQMPYVTVVSNGLRPVPMAGFENVNLDISVFGGGPIDDQLRAIKPNGSRFEGLFNTALENYRNDPRVIFIYALSEPGIPYIRETVQRIADNGNQVTFSFYSAYDSDDPVRLTEGRRLMDEALAVRQEFPDVVVSHPYYIKTMITGSSHWGQFGYDTCPSISNKHEANAARLTNGHPVLPQFNVYSADLETVQFCCTSGDCGNCRDSQAINSWLLANMQHFLADSEQLTTWLELAESFWRQFRWAPYHPHATS